VYFVGGFWVFFTVLGAVIYFHYNHIEGLVLGLRIIVLVMIVWWWDVIRESTYQGKHTLVVKRGIKYGIVLFILSEVCLFFSFFEHFFIVLLLIRNISITHLLLKKVLTY